VGIGGGKGVASNPAGAPDGRKSDVGLEGEASESRQQEERNVGDTRYRGSKPRGKVPKAFTARDREPSDTSDLVQKARPFRRDCGRRGAGEHCNGGPLRGSLRRALSDFIQKKDDGRGSSFKKEVENVLLSWLTRFDGGKSYMGRTSRGEDGRECERRRSKAGDRS